MTQHDRDYGKNPGDYRNNPNRRDDLESQGTGWGVAIVVALVLILGVYLVARAWRNDRGDVAGTNTGPSISSPSDTTPGRVPPVGPLDDAVPAAGVQQPTTMPSGSMMLDNLLQQPANFYGQNVNVQGTVRNVLNNSAFTIASDAAGGQEILVVSNQAISPAPAQGQRVRISGTFNMYDQSRIQETLGTNFNQEQFSAYSDRPTIVAQRIDRMGDVAQ